MPGANRPHDSALALRTHHNYMVLIRNKSTHIIRITVKLDISGHRSTSQRQIALQFLLSRNLSRVGRNSVTGNNDTLTGNIFRTASTASAGSVQHTILRNRQISSNFHAAQSGSTSNRQCIFSPVTVKILLVHSVPIINGVSNPRDSVIHGIDICTGRKPQLVGRMNLSDPQLTSPAVNPVSVHVHSTGISAHVDIQVWNVSTHMLLDGNGPNLELSSAIIRSRQKSGRSQNPNVSALAFNAHIPIIPVKSTLNRLAVYQLNNGGALHL